MLKQSSLCSWETETITPFIVRNESSHHFPCGKLKQLLLSLWETETIIPVLLEIEEETEITSPYKVRLCLKMLLLSPYTPHLLFENMLNISPLPLSVSHTHTHANTRTRHTYTHTHTHAQHTHTHTHTLMHNTHTHSCTTHTHTHRVFNSTCYFVPKYQAPSCYYPFVHTLQSAQPCTHLSCS